MGAWFWIAGALSTGLIAVGCGNAPEEPATALTAAADTAYCGVPGGDLPPQGGTVTGALSGEGLYRSACQHTGKNGAEAIYRWVPSATGSAKIAVTGDAGFQPILYLYRGGCLWGDAPRSTEVTCQCGAQNSQASFTTSVEAGVPYFIFVDFDSQEFNGGTFTVTVTPLGTSPPGTCIAPFQIPSQGGSYSGNTSGSTASYMGWCTYSYSNDLPEQVYTYSPAFNGLSAGWVSTTISGSRMSIRRGTSCYEGNTFACEGPSSPRDFWLSNGEPYMFLVEAQEGQPYTLTVTPKGDAPGPGTCTNPIPVGEYYAGSTTGHIPVVNTCGNSPGTPEVVHRWLPPKAGFWQLRVDRMGANSNLIATVDAWRGSCAGSGLVDYCGRIDPLNGSSARANTFYLAQGEAIYIAVGGVGGTSGDYALSMVLLDHP